MADTAVQQYIHSRHIQCDQLTPEQLQKLRNLRNTTNALRQEVDNEEADFCRTPTGLKARWSNFIEKVKAAPPPGPDPDLLQEAKNLLDEARALQRRLADIETRTVVVAKEINDLTLDILQPNNSGFDKLLGNTLNNTFNGLQGQGSPTDGLRQQVAYIIAKIAEIYLEDPPCSFCDPGQCA